MDYRKLYEEHYKIKIPEDFVVHHIDRNRSNNSIDNLLLLPFHLHQKFHLTAKVIENSNYSLYDIITDTYLASCIKYYGESIKEIERYAIMKEAEDMIMGGYGEYSYDNFR